MLLDGWVDHVALCKTVFNTSSLLMRQTGCEVTGFLNEETCMAILHYLQPTIWAISLPQQLPYHLVTSYDIQDRGGTILKPDRSLKALP